MFGDFFKGGLGKIAMKQILTPENMNTFFASIAEGIEGMEARSGREVTFTLKRIPGTKYLQLTHWEKDRETQKLDVVKHYTNANLPELFNIFKSATNGDYTDTKAIGSPETATGE